MLVRPDRNGYMYVIDRLTGQVLSATPYVYTTTTKGVDLNTGALIHVDEKKPEVGKETVNICPMAPGSKDWQPSSFSPRTGLVYVPHENMCMDEQYNEANYIAGTPYIGATVRYYPGPGGNMGELMAWDPIAGKKVWTIPDKYPDVERNGGDGGRSCLLRNAGRLVQSGGRANRQDAVAVQDGLRHYRPAHHLSRPGRQAIRRHTFRRRRVAGFHCLRPTSTRATTLQPMDGEAPFVI